MRYGTRAIFLSFVFLSSVQAAHPDEAAIRETIQRQITAATENALPENLHAQWKMTREGLPDASTLALLKKNAKEPGVVGAVNQAMLDKYSRREWPCTTYQLWFADREHWRLSVDMDWDTGGWWDTAMVGNDGWRAGRDFIDTIDLTRPQAGYDNRNLIRVTLQQLNLFRFASFRMIAKQNPRAGLECTINGGNTDTIALVIPPAGTSAERVLKAKWNQTDRRLEPFESVLASVDVGLQPTVDTYENWDQEAALSGYVAHRVVISDPNKGSKIVLELQSVEIVSRDTMRSVLRLPASQEVDPVRGLMVPKSMTYRVGDSSTSKLLDSNNNVVETISGIEPGVRNMQILQRTGYWITGSITVAAVAVGVAVRKRRSELFRRKLGDRI